MALNTRYTSESHKDRGESFDNYKIHNESQKIASESLEKVTTLLISNNGDLWSPAIIWIDWNPWLWKSHLLSAVKSQLKNAWIEFYFNADEHLLLMDDNYKWSKIIIIDDLFQNVTDFSKISNYELWKIKDLIFEIYESKAILIVSSNFSIENILNEVSKIDQRIASRVTELLWHTMPLHITWDDYRIQKAQEVSELSRIFEEVRDWVKTRLIEDDNK